jgi:transposase
VSTEVFNGKITAMKTLLQLDELNLDAAAQTQVAARVRALLDQAKTEAAKYYEADIQAKDLKIQALILELAHLRRIRYGVKNEALSSLQSDLFQEACNEDIAALEAEVEQADEQIGSAVTKPKRPRAGRQPLPPHLPRIEHLHEPESCQCGQCGKDLVKIGKDITEQLDVEPAKFFVHRHIRPQYACRACETITAAPIPPAIIDGGMAAVGLLTWVMVSKYLDHLPLYRLEQIAARDQVILASSTLAEWVGCTGVALQPLADRLREVLLEHGTIHADETPVAQLDPGSGKTKRAYLWAYRSNDLEAGPRIIVFDYRGGRSGEHARQFLGAWQGHLVVDDYGGYKALFSPARQEALPCIELGCWAHARRKFFDLHQANASSMALEALTRIGQLYTIEQQGKALDIDARQQLRAQQSQPVLDALHQWLTKTRANTANGGGSAKAMDYTLKRWTALLRYAETGHLPIDNNPVENSIRPIALGKKNWLFAGSERAGIRAAAIQTLLGTAKLNGIDPAAWLRDTLEKLPTWPNSRIDELLPFARPVEDVKAQGDNNG